MITDFFTFKKMLTPVIMAALFVIGIIVILVVGISNYPYLLGFNVNNGFAYFIGLLAVILVWRVFCEWAVIAFSIHERLVEAQKND